MSVQRRVAVAVVGNGVGGFACAAALAEAGLAPVLIGPGLPHDRPPLSKRGARDGPAAACSPPRTCSSRARHPAPRRPRHDARPRERTGSRCRRATAGDPVVLEAETIVWATGFEYPPPPVPGLERAHVNATGDGHARARRRARRGRPARARRRRRADRLRDRRDPRGPATPSRSSTCWTRPLERFGPDVATRAAEVARRARRDLRRRAARSQSARRAQRASPWSRRPRDGTLAARRRDRRAPASARPCPRASRTRPRPPAIDVDELAPRAWTRRRLAIGDAISFPHPRYGRSRSRTGINARSGRHPRADDHPRRADGALRPRPVLLLRHRPAAPPAGRPAAAVVEWEDRRGRPRLGLDAAGLPRSALLFDVPGPSAEARELAGRSRNPIPRGDDMPVRVVVDPDVCIGSGECVAEDPDAVELDDSGCARAEARAARRGPRRGAVRRLPGGCARDRALTPEGRGWASCPEHDPRPRRERPRHGSRARRARGRRAARGARRRPHGGVAAGHPRTGRAHVRGAPDAAAVRRHDVPERGLVRRARDRPRHPVLVALRAPPAAVHGRRARRVPAGRPHRRAVEARARREPLRARARRCRSG